MHCTETLRQKGYRLTPQRGMILAAIQASEDHVSAEEIHELVRAKYPHINISTVYRTLDLLQELGLVAGADLGGGTCRYHLAERGRHHHLVCQRCGRMIELDEGILAPLKKALVKQYGFKTDLRHLAVFGRCDQCR